VAGFLAGVMLSFLACGAMTEDRFEEYRPRATVAPSAFSPEALTYLSAIEARAWALACRYKNVDCVARNLRPPLVGYVVLPRNLFGLYEPGSSSVQINIGLMGQDFSGLVMVHEMIHYLQSVTHERGLLTSCEAEEEAFTLTFRLMLDLNTFDRRVATWSEIKYQYGCPRTLIIKGIK
jgi:hypothetical protein